MELNGKHIAIPIFIPHKGCPFDCIYCNQKIISGQIEEMTVPKMRSIIEEHLATIDRSSPDVQIAFYGGSFTGIPDDEQVAFLECANEYISSGKVHSVRLSTRPDYIDDEILSRLKKYNTKVIELGAQSMDDTVLKNSCRGHSKEAVYKASNLIKKYGFELGLQTMIGLPGDSEEKAINTAKEIAEINPEVVRIYPALVIKGTFMEKLYLEGKYQPLNLDSAVELCAKLMDIYEAKDINVIRVGLQPTESINNDMDVVAGPFHPAFRQLVESKRILTILIKKLDEYENLQGKSITIITNNSNISNVVGQKACNLKFIKKSYGVSEIKVRDTDFSKEQNGVYIFV